MHVIKINQGRADLCDSKFGSFIRTLASRGVIDADINDDGIVLITFDDGSVRIMREDKSFIRTIRSMSNSQAVSARWSGDDIALRLANGRTELRRVGGGFIRRF